MNLSWILVFGLLGSVDASPNEMRRKDIGRMKYGDGEVILFQNEERASEFFFTPFASLQSDKCQCDLNTFTDRIELSLPVELYPSDLILSIQHYLSKHYPDFCSTPTSAFQCDVSLLPIKSIRLIQGNTTSNVNHNKYTLDHTYKSATFPRQSMEFSLYPSNATVCEQIRRSLTNNCRLADLQLQYTTENEQTTQTEFEVTTEHITKTVLYQQMRAQSSSTESILLTDEHFKELVNQSIELITIGLTTQQHNFARLLNVQTIENQLRKQLSSQQIQLETNNNKLWDKLFYKPHSTRPDLLAKIVNSFITKDLDDEDFTYSHLDSINRTGVLFTPFHLYPTETKQHTATQSDTSEEEKHFFVESIKQQLPEDNTRTQMMPLKQEQSDDGTTQYIITRQQIINYLRLLSPHLFLDDDDIKAHPINTHLISLQTWKINQKLFSTTLLIQLQPRTFQLPLRCQASQTNNHTTQPTKHPRLATHSKWNPKGVIIAGGNGQGQRLNQLKQPFGMSLDEDEDIYIADKSNHRIIKWNKGQNRGTVVAGGNGKGCGRNQLNHPVNVIIDHHNDALIIADRGNNRVVSWPRHKSQHPRTIISNITAFGLAIDRHGQLYASDEDNDEVRTWKKGGKGGKQGTLVAGGCGSGKGLHQLNYPRHVFVDHNQSVYVADTGNHRVVKWIKGEKKGTVVAGGQGKGSTLKHLSSPNGIFVDQFQSVYVADSSNHRIVRWLKGSKQGQLIIGNYGRGNQTNQLNTPVHLARDHKNNLLVLDFANHRVHKFLLLQNKNL